MIDIKNNLEKILKGEIIIQYNSTFRKHIINNNIFEYKCNKCGIKEWLGSPITLEIEHVNGNNWINKRENLELLCPNCHSQTSTYRSKKLLKQKPIIDEKIIIQELEKGNNINQTLTSLGLDNSGGNYKRIHKILKKLENQNILIEKVKTKKQLFDIKTSKKINNIQQQIEFIKKNIDFTKRGWNKDISKILNITPQAVKQWMKREMKDVYEKAWHHSDNNILI